jgi:hypothetical protein
VVFEHDKLCAEMAGRVGAPRTIANTCWRGHQLTSPYSGLPQSSVDKIAGGGVQAEVDWVKVEQRG